MCPLAACRNDVGYRSIEAFECCCGSILTPKKKNISQHTIATTAITLKSKLSRVKMTP